MEGGKNIISLGVLGNLNLQAVCRVSIIIHSSAAKVSIICQNCLWVSSLKRARPKQIIDLIYWIILFPKPPLHEKLSYLVSASSLSSRHRSQLFSWQIKEHSWTTTTATKTWLCVIKGIKNAGGWHSLVNWSTKLSISGSFRLLLIWIRRGTAWEWLRFICSNRR